MLDPSYAEAYVSRGAILYNKGDFDKAIADENAALAIDPSMAQAYGNRGSAWDLKGEYAKAKADFDQALAIDGNNAEFIDELAFFQATCLDPQFRNGQQAFANASKAFQLTGGTGASTISVLASVYAENGDFTQAITYQQKALDLTPSQEMKQRDWRDCALQAEQAVPPRPQDGAASSGRRQGHGRQDGLRCANVSPPSPIGRGAGGEGLSDLMTIALFRFCTA